MSHKIQAQSINPPKGGGAIKGIGETFSPNSFSGTGSMSIPIPISPCRGFEPALALQYSSAEGNTAFGLGFSLSIPAISCATNKGTPRYDGTDHYVMDGGNYLVPLKDKNSEKKLNNINYTVQQYVPRQLGNFSLIEFWQPVEKKTKEISFWKVTSKDHIISILGKTDEAQIVNPDNPKQVFSWLLQEVYDTVGNHQLYNYKKENNENVNGNLVYEKNRTFAAQRYLSKVQYGNAKPIVDSILLNIDSIKIINDTRWHFEIIFNYGEYNLPDIDNSNPYNPAPQWNCRPDPFSTYQPGFEVRTYRRCQGVMLFHHFEELGKEPVLVESSNYRYADLEQKNGFISQLIGVTDIGYILKGTNYESASYPELELGYTSFNPVGHTFDTLDAASGSLNGLNESPYSLVDLYGHGIPGILYADGQTVSYREPIIESPEQQNQTSFSESGNLAWKDKDMKYGEWQVQNDFPITKSVSGAGISLGDQTGNGQLDLLVSQSGNTNYWQANADGTWANAKTFEQFPLDYGAPNQTQVNATGAGLSDLLQIRNTEVIVNPSARAKGFGSAIIQERELSMPDMLESSEVTLLQFSDLAGSGTPQFVQVEQEKVTYWPNFSYGRFGKPVTMKNAPKFPGQFTTSRLFLADIDGSGTTDLLYVEKDSLYIYFNQNGNSFSDAFILKLPYIFDSLDYISFADVYGQGTTCLILTFPHGLPDQKDLSPRFLCYDFCQHKKPFLMNKVINNMGTETDMEYASSVDYYLKDKKEKLNWVTNIPFPVQVIAKTTVYDALSDTRYTSQYAYHHGYYDGEEREFKGFGRVDTQDTEYFFSSEKPEYVAPVLTRTWYNVGCPKVQYELLMAQYQKEYFNGDEKAFSFLESTIICDNAESKSQAYAALAGTMIHSEVYLLEDSGKDAVPYTVSQNNYKVTLRQEKEQNWYAVFFVESRESISYAYDRKSSDPQIHQQFTLEVDEFGNVEKEVSIAYPRRGKQEVEKCKIEQLTLEQQYTTKVVCTINRYINKKDGTEYLLGVPYESQSYHITSLNAPANAAFTFDKISKEVNDALLTITKENPSSEKADLIAWERMLYAKIETEETKVFPLGTAALPLLPYQVHGVLDNQNVLLEIYKGVLDKVSLQDKLKQGYYNFDEESNYWWNCGATQHYFGSDTFYFPRATTLPYSGVELSTTSYEYDKYNLLLQKITDAMGNTTEVVTNYRVLQPDKIIDLNEICSQVSFDALGQVVYTTVQGHEDGKAVGFDSIDTAPDKQPKNSQEIIENPEKFLGNMQSYFYYDLFAYQNNKQPVNALSLVAINYPTAVIKSLPAFDMAPIQIALTYSDGLGRELQTKALSGQEKNQWLTTGKKQYNNKGEVIKEYEPYFAADAGYVVAEEVGVSSTLFYDPIGRLIKTLTSKGFLLLQKYSPWEIENWDANDSILDSPYYKVNIVKIDKASPFYDPQLSPAGKENLEYVATNFSNTQEASLLDNMGNTILEKRINQFPSDVCKPLSKESSVNKEILSTYHLYDIEAKLIKSSDPRLSKEGIWNFEMDYVIGLEDALKTKNVDAGTSWVLPNIVGNSIYSNNSRSIATTTQYDCLYRPIATHVEKTICNDKDPLLINQIIERLVYGDSPESGAPVHCNLKGQVYKHFESSGLTTTSSYSITGQPMQSSQQFFNDYKKQGNWDDISEATQVTLLQKEHYANSAVYDALGRVIEETDSDGNKVSPKYYLSGWLNTLQLTAKDALPSNYVNGITYDAKGQRQTITYGNQTRTAYTYDPKTFAPIWIRTCQIKEEQDKTCIQDISYQYDPVGNVFRKEILSEDSVCYKNQKVDPVCTYLYDAIYQLIKATGREKIGEFNGANPESASAGVNDYQAIQNYIERYSYDTGGNLITKKHLAANNNTTQTMVVSDSSNRSVEAGIEGLGNEISPDEVAVFFDANGNQVDLKTIHPLRWDCKDQLQSVTIIARTQHRGPGSPEINDKEYYVYNSSGQRVRKVNECYLMGGLFLIIKQTYYLGNLEIRQTWQGKDATTAVLKEDYHSLRLLDGGNAVATRSTWLLGKPKDVNGPVTIYHLQDNLGSYTTQVSDVGVVIAREEYSPFGGSTLFKGTGAAYLLTHYRYSGKERDSATGFYYYGMRYYAPWLCRWLNPDPAGTIDGLNVYAFVGNNPVTFVDPNGMAKKGKFSPIKVTKKINKKANKKVITQEQKEYDAIQLERNSITPSGSIPSPARIGKYTGVHFDNNTHIATYFWSKAEMKKSFPQKETYLYIKDQVRQKFISANKVLKDNSLKAVPGFLNPVKTASQEYIKLKVPLQHHVLNPSGTIDIRATLNNFNPPQLKKVHTGQKRKNLPVKRRSLVSFTPQKLKDLRQDVDEFFSRNQGGPTVLQKPNIDNQGGINYFANQRSGPTDNMLRAQYKSIYILQFHIVFLEKF
jgi:RHS repeat-associated protein